MSLETLMENSKVYEFSQEKIDSQEQGRLEFISKFPIDRIKNLTIDEYVAGTDKNSFSYWLEFKKILCGIGGGNASKFGIYKSKDGNYYEEVGQNKTQLTAEKLENEFQKIKTGILTAIDYVKNDRISEIKNLDIPIWKMVLQKILIIYFPDKFLSIAASDALISLGKDIQLKNVDLDPKNLIEINYNCRKYLNSIAEFRGWNYEKISSLVWSIYRKDIIDPDLMNDKSKKSGGYKAAYIQWLDKAGEGDSKKKESYVRAIEILSELLQDDIFHQDNLSKLDSLYKDLLKEQGLEESKYYYKDAPSYGKSGFYSAAISTYSDFLKEHLAIHPKVMVHLNKILFGPPGTGKTYNTINKALEIVGIDIQGKSRTEVKKLFDARMQEGQVVFTTFHQSMSYEDFIEGIKPLEPTGEEQPVTYKVVDGIFKRACARAAYNCYQMFTQSKARPDTYTFDDLYDAFTGSIQEQLDNGTPPVYKTLRGREVEVKEINSNDSIIARAKNSIANSSAPLTKENLQKLYDRFKNIEEIEDLKQVQETVQVTPRITEFYAVFSGLKEFEMTYRPDLLVLSENKEVVSLNWEEIQRKFNAGVYRDAVNNFGDQAEPVVLVIDEINRGNVSQIFGELITLIESDKRLGKDESLEATLPYSKEKFGVPPNLFILGTMNTADRSVEALDAALRRRFSFEEIPPKYGLEELRYEFAGIPIDSMLKTVNQRIEKILDKDHSIGHSYFILKNGMDVRSNLLATFYGNIIPLLQEYFFGDYGKIGLVIGQGFVRRKEWDRNGASFAEFDYESSSDLEDREVYEIIHYTDPEVKYFLKRKVDQEDRLVPMTFEKAIQLLMKQDIE